MVAFLCPVPLLRPKPLPLVVATLFDVNHFSFFATIPTVAANDILVLFYADDGTTTIDARISAPGRTVTLIGTKGITSQPGKTAVWWTRCDGTEGGEGWELYNNNFDGGRAIGVGVVVRNCIASGTPYESYSSNNGSSSNAGPTASTVTTASNDLALRFFARNDTTAGTPASGWTEEIEQTQSTAYGGVSAAIDSKLIAAAGTEAGTSHTISGSANWMTHSLALLSA